MPTVMIREFYNTDPDHRHEFVKKFLNVFHVFPEVDIQLETAEDCCDEMFDISNNPIRQQERIHIFSALCFRGMRLGDVVEVDNVNWMCDSIGWKKLE